MKMAERVRHDEYALEKPGEVTVDAELIVRHVEVLARPRSR